MAEEKQGQGTNPPQEQPNEPLPSECYSQNCSFQIYSGFVRVNLTRGLLFELDIYLVVLNS